MKKYYVYRLLLNPVYTDKGGVPRGEANKVGLTSDIMMRMKTYFTASKITEGVTHEILDIIETETLSEAQEIEHMYQDKYGYIDGRRKLLKEGTHPFQNLTSSATAKRAIIYKDGVIVANNVILREWCRETFDNWNTAYIQMSKVATNKAKQYKGYTVEYV